MMDRAPTTSDPLRMTPEEMIKLTDEQEQIFRLMYPQPLGDQCPRCGTLNGIHLMSCTYLERRRKMIELLKKFLETKDPADYKAWSDAVDQMTDEELHCAAGGHAQIDPVV